MLRRLGQFLTSKIEKTPTFKKGLRVAQAIRFFKDILKEDLGLSVSELKELDFDYEDDYLIVRAKNRMLLQEINLSASSYKEKINSQLDAGLVAGIKTKRKKK